MRSDQQLPLPLRPLLALAAGAFVTIVTEAMPAGLLREMSQGLSVSESWIGQTVTIYAIGSLLAAMPLTAATQQMRRRPLLLAGQHAETSNELFEVLADWNAQLEHRKSTTDSPVPPCP